MTLPWRRTALKKLLQTQQRSQLQLVSRDELEAIERESGERMTLNTLQLCRKVAPFVITLACLLPWFWFLFRTDILGGAWISWIFAAFAFWLIVSFSYVILKLREPRWKGETEKYVGAQIKKFLVKLIPGDLNITSTEREQLVNSAIYKKLNGVFWEAVDQSDLLRAQKEQFYSNGLRVLNRDRHFSSTSFLRNLLLECLARPWRYLAFHCWDATNSVGAGG